MNAIVYQHKLHSIPFLTGDQSHTVRLLNIITYQIIRFENGWGVDAGKSAADDVVKASMVGDYSERWR